MPIRPAEDRYGNKGRRCSGGCGARGLLSRGRPARLACAKVAFSGRTHALDDVILYIGRCLCAYDGGGGSACTRALTDTWVPRSSAPSRRCHHRRRARSSIRYYSSSSFPARQNTVDYRAYWPHFSPDHSQQLTHTRAGRPRSRPDPFRRTHTVSAAAPASFRRSTHHREFVTVVRIPTYLLPTTSMSVSHVIIATSTTDDINIINIIIYLRALK